MKEEIIIISLGGSLIIPEEIDVGFLKDFKKLILEQVAKPARNADGIASAGGGKKFIIVTGGGKICRRYNNATREIIDPSNVDLDWLGIAATRLNAELVRIIFGDQAYEKIIMNPEVAPDMSKSIAVGGGWKPGNSSDMAAVHLAKNIGAKKIINLSDTNLYDSDPKKNPEAKKIEKISWTDFRALVPKEWVPGLNFPFDPTASITAQAEGMEVIIMNGKPIENFAKCLNGEKFLGTTIK
jgi:uridylate kinase